MAENEALAVQDKKPKKGTPEYALELMRKPFEAHQVSKMCKPTKKDNPPGRCNACGGWHKLPAVQLSYVGHAALTDRLLDVDPRWSWEPLAYAQNGTPLLDNDGGMWIKLTVAGVTRLGYGDAQGKMGGDATKERIGDALRNAAMRFGAALELWHKGNLHVVEEPADDEDKETNKDYDQRTEDQRIVMPAQAQAMHEAMKRTGKPEALVTEYLAKKGYKQFEQVLRSDFQEILKWLNTAHKASGDDLTPDLKKSVRDAVNKKLWAVAAEKSIPEGDIKKFAYEKFGVQSMTALDASQLREVLDWASSI